MKKEQISLESGGIRDKLKESKMYFRKKPVVIEAFKWTGDINQKEDPEWMNKAIQDGTACFNDKGTENCTLEIKTLEGNHTAKRGDYIIQGIQGELYPCKPDIFEKTYEPIHCDEEKMKKAQISLEVM